MRIFALNPPYVKNFCRSARWATVSRGRVQRHPDYFLIALAVLEKGGHQVKFIDGAASNMSPENVASEITQFQPDMFVFHTTTPSIYNDLGYALMVKEIFPTCLTVAIGAHVSAVPENTFEVSVERFQNSLDAIAIQEYDFSLLDLANNPSKLHELSGFASKIDNKICIRANLEIIDVNKLPFPAWHHIDINNYKDAGKRFPFLTLIHGRGCHGKCTFCRDMNSMRGRQIRLRTPELIVEEIEKDIELFPELQEVMFETDTFASDASHTEELCKLMIKRNINRKISWSCNTRVDIDLDLLPLMKEAGGRMLMTGFEFGTQASLDSVNKGVTLKQAKHFAKTAHKLGFTLHGCFMIGAPNETVKSALQTIAFAKSLPCDTVQFAGICPYPGTPIYNWAKNNGYLVPKDWTEWVNSEYEQCTLLSYPELSKMQIDELIDKGLKEFYLRPKQIFRMLQNISNITDLWRKIFGFKQFVSYFRNKD